MPLSNCIWDFGDGETELTCGNVSHSYSKEGCYDVTIYGDSKAGCRAKKESSGLVCVHPNPIADIETSETTVKASFPNFNFTNISENAISYVWDFDGEGSSTLEHPSFKFPGETASYNVCLEATSEFGCKDDICHNVFVEEDILISVPNAFTPNGDGLNDEFNVVLRGFGEKPIFMIQIWNRWGELVYEVMDAAKPWDGIVNNNAPTTNTFVWKIFAKDENGKEYDLMGHVSVLK